MAANFGWYVSLSLKHSSHGELDHLKGASGQAPSVRGATSSESQDPEAVKSRVPLPSESAVSSSEKPMIQSILNQVPHEMHHLRRVQDVT